MSENLKPVTRNDYDRIHESTWKGTRLKLIKGLKTPYGLIPAGTEVTVLRKHSGFGVETVKCKCCGGHFYAYKVPHYYFSWA